MLLSLTSSTVIRDMDSSPTAIAKRLEALNKWHKEYRTILETSRERNTYKTLGILFPDESFSGNNSTGAESPNMKNGDDITTNLSKRTSGYSSEHRFENNEGNDPELQSVPEAANQQQNPIPKKFLRRGEGLRQRFKISPDAFNLKNLPPYKYAKSHSKPGKVEKQADKPAVAKQTKKPADVVKVDERQNLAANLDQQELNFQRALFTSATVVNSTPDSKSTAFQANSASSRTTENPVQQTPESQQQQSTCTNTNPNSTDGIHLDMAWSTVLDPLNIKPITVAKLRGQESTLNESDDDNLNLFELLEQKANEGSFNLDSSIIKELLTKNKLRKQQSEQDSDIIPVAAEIRSAHISPQATRLEDNDDSSASENQQSGSGSDSETDSEFEFKKTNDENVDASAADTLINDNDSSGRPIGLRVRFVEDEDTTLGGETEASTQVEDTLTESNSGIIFQQLKELVFSALGKSEKSLSEMVLSDNSALNSQEMKALADQGRMRLAELEREIALFKETNSQLLKAKQEHELEKVFFMQQQEEALEQINDEKVKMEIQLHDERIKLEEERRKMEEKSRMQKNSLASTERKEITKLKEEIAMLHAKLRDKEQAHVASQGRLRSQVRCMEKEMKVLYAEIEKLNKENKRLEKHNSQLSRERNMTMLQEINRNIVKLAGSQNHTTSCTELNNQAVINSNNNSKSAMPTKSTLRKQDRGSNQTSKVLKITANSFSNLIPKTGGECPPEYQAVELVGREDDEQNFDVEEQENKPPQPPADDLTNTTTEKAPPADAQNASFKVLTRESTTADGGKEILYPNGTLRKDSGDGLTVRMMYFNGDIKETSVKEGTIKYYYAKTNTWHTTYLDGLEIIEFPNGQIEHRQPNGVTEVHFPHKNCVKVMDPKDEEKSAEWRFHDGSTLQEMRNGDTLLTLSNGQKELHTKQFKRREYPDGTIKTVFPDGSYETRYSNGRLRLKDKDGNLIMDTEMQESNNE